MKTSNIEVGDMLSILSVLGVETRIGEVPGVESVTVNYAAGNASVRYDETRLNVAGIKSAVRQGEYERAETVAASAGDGHEGRAAPGAPPATAAPKSAPDAAAAAPASADPSGDGQGKTAPSAPPPAAAAPKTSPTASPTSDAPKSASDANAVHAGGAEHDKAGTDKG